MTQVRRVLSREWPNVRTLRLEALQDPAAPIAFGETYADAVGRPDQFWKDRAGNAARGHGAAQFVAVGDTGVWMGSVTVLVHAAGVSDHNGRTMSRRRASVVGVYVRPDRRGLGLIDQLLGAAARWAGDQGLTELRLDVHVDNARARRAYERAGFTESGEEFSGAVGPEIEMVRRF